MILAHGRRTSPRSIVAGLDWWQFSGAIRIFVSSTPSGELRTDAAEHAERITLAILVGFGLAGRKPDDELVGFSFGEVAEAPHGGLAGLDGGMGPGQVEGAIEVLECKAVFVEHDPDSLVRGLGVFSRFLSADGFLHQAISVHASANPIALTA